MRVLRILVLTSVILLLSGANSPQTHYQYVIKTTMGDIKIKLYSDVSRHAENFEKLVDKKFYDDLLFHRVMKDFMIQCGDPHSRNAPPGMSLGVAGPGYTIPAEIKSKYIHKRGALAAARRSDDKNPKRESSGSQFYIVQGMVFHNKQLDFMENQRNAKVKQQCKEEFVRRPENKWIQKKIVQFQREKNQDSISHYAEQLTHMVESQIDPNRLFYFTEKQRKTYTTIGGTPHLDGDYTVFGEVTEGLDIVEKISLAEGDRRNRPKKDIKIITITKI